MLTIKSLNYKRFLYVLALVSLLCVAGCKNKDISKEITDFDKSVVTGTTAIAAYYNNLNAQEYDLYFEMLKADATLEVGEQIKFPKVDEHGNHEKDAQGKLQYVFVDSPLKRPPFSAKGIQARINLLKELTNYSRSLASLAGADSPANFKANVSALKGRLESLHSTFEGLSKEGETQAVKYLEPLQKVIGIVGKWYLDHRRWKVISQSVIAAEVPINTLLAAVAADLDSDIGLLTVLTADDRYTQSIVFYNLNKSSKTEAQRAVMLDQIRRYKEAYDIAEATRPSRVAIRMKSVHQALVDAAKSNRNPADLAALKAQLALFKDDVSELADAVIQLSGLTKEND